MKRMCTPLFCGIALLLMAFMAPAAFAGNADKLNGSWTVDVEASLKLASQRPGYSDGQAAELGQMLGGMRITFDIPGKRFIVAHNTMPSESMPIDAVTENADGTVLITGKGLNDTYEFQADGTIRLKDNIIVFKKDK